MKQNEAMQKKRPPSLTDQRLRQLLKQLREEPAAPQDFRAQVMARLEREGVLPRSAPAQPVFGWVQRLQALVRPAGFGLAAAGALALLIVLRPAAPVLAPLAAAPAPAPAAKPLASAAPIRHRSVTTAKLVARPTEASVEHALETASQAQPQAPLALGAAAAPTVGQQVQAAGVGPSPTPGPTMGKPGDLGFNSKVYNNVIRASRGGVEGAAYVHFQLHTAGTVRIVVVDRLGRQVSTVFDGDLSAGSFNTDNLDSRFNWTGTMDNGGYAASGIYILRIQTPDYTETHKLMLVK